VGEQLTPKRLHELGEGGLDALALQRVGQGGVDGGLGHSVAGDIQHVLVGGRCLAFVLQQPLHFFRGELFAAFVELLLPVAFWQALSDRRHAWLGWSAAALLFATVIASGSRAGALLVTAEVVIQKPHMLSSWL